MVQRTNGEQDCEAISTLNLSSLEHVSRMVGRTLEAALTLCERQLCREGDYEAAEKLRDQVKPVCDYLMHLDLTWVHEGPDEETEILEE